MHQSISRSRVKGYVFPFEGTHHKGTIIELPYRLDTWRENAAPGRECFLNLVKIISRYEMVYLVVSEEIKEEELAPFRMENVTVVPLEYNDSWARDNTLIYLMKDGKRIAVDYGFNAWGGAVDGLYSNWQDDNALGLGLADYFNDEYLPYKDFILEGGSIHTDGEGTLLTTEACLLSKGRNSNLTKEEIEEKLKETLNAEKVLWLPHGIYNDETNEHVDNVCCFLAPGVVALATSKNKDDIQYQYSMESEKYLESVTDANGRKLKIIEIPVPETLYMTEEEAKSLVSMDGIVRPAGNRMAGSYINFYQSDKFVIVPKFNVPEDEYAYQVLKDFYKNKDVYQLESREILLGGGNIHCVTMQIPEEEK